jgi:hypothetical protein
VIISSVILPFEGRHRKNLKSLRSPQANPQFFAWKLRRARQIVKLSSGSACLALGCDTKDLWLAAQLEVDRLLLLSWSGGFARSAGCGDQEKADGRRQVFWSPGNAKKMLKMEVCPRKYCRISKSSLNVPAKCRFCARKVAILSGQRRMEVCGTGVSNPSPLRS